jgi:hypothetical protein
MTHDWTTTAQDQTNTAIDEVESFYWDAASAFVTAERTPELAKTDTRGTLDCMKMMNGGEGYVEVDVDNQAYCLGLRQGA